MIDIKGNHYLTDDLGYLRTFPARKKTFELRISAFSKIYFLSIILLKLTDFKMRKNISYFIVMIIFLCFFFSLDYHIF